jgi:hypothetical protein
LQKAVERWCRNYRKKYRARITIAVNPDRSKSYFAPAYGRQNEAVQDFLECVELDGSPADRLTTKSGHRRRLIAMIDKLTKLPVVIVAPSESTAAFGRLLVKGHRIFRGLPQRIRTDHGSGFVSQAARIGLAQAAVKIELATKYEPRGKGTIEAFMHALQRHMELTKGFAGHDPVQRAKLRAFFSMSQRRGLSEADTIGIDLTDEEFETEIDQFLYGFYMHRKHRGYGMQVTPHQKLMAWVDRGERLAASTSSPSQFTWRARPQSCHQKRHISRRLFIRCT